MQLVGISGPYHEGQKMYVVHRRGSRGIDRIQLDVEDVFHSLVASGRPAVPAGSHGPTWRPAVEVYETDDALVVLAEVAGLSEDQIEVVIDESIMTIRGERLPVTRDARCRIHAMGIPYGPFAVDVYLPFPVDHDGVDARYDAGILQVRLPRVPATTVAINVEGQSSGC